MPNPLGLSGEPSVRASVAWSGEPEVQKRDRGSRGVVAGTVGVPVQAVSAVQLLSYVLVGLQAGVAAVAHERAIGVVVVHVLHVSVGVGHYVVVA